MGGGTFISTIPCDVTLVTTAVTFWKKQPTSSMNEYYGKSVAVVVLALEPLWSGAIPA